VSVHAGVHRSHPWKANGGGWRKRETLQSCSRRAGLVELFYGVYQRDSDKCLDALSAMGVFVSGGDRVAIKRTADFFLDSFQQRLTEQRVERETDPNSQKDFKQAKSKEETKERRKAVRTL
jgi:hypothetical protein